VIMSSRVARVIGHLAASSSATATAAPVSSSKGLFENKSGEPATVEASGPLRHFVSFRFRDSVTQEQRLDAAKRYVGMIDQCKLPSGAPYIISIEGGMQNNTEGFDQQHQVGFIVTFRNAAERDYFVYKDTTPAATRAFMRPLLLTDAPPTMPKFIFDFTVSGALSAYRTPGGPPPPVSGAYPPTLKADKDMLKKLETMFLAS